MKNIMFFCFLFLSVFSFAQVRDGGERICGDEYKSYGFSGMTLKDALEFSGATHDEFQEYIFKELSDVKPDFTNDGSFNELMKEKTANFFKERKLYFDENFFHSTLSTTVDFEWNTESLKLSENGTNILKKANEIIKAFDERLFSENINTLNDLRNEALNLEDFDEAVKVGLPITIAVHSYQYWNKNAQKWFDTFTDIKDPKNPDNSGSTAKAVKVNLWHVGGADAGGAVSGAIDGVALGPGGALAGGILGAAVASSYNLVNQVIGSYVSWWPW